VFIKPKIYQHDPQPVIMAFAIKVLNRVKWKLQLYALVLYMAAILIGFLLIPKEPAMYGMGMIPGPLALFSGFGLPVISSFGIGVAVYRRSKPYEKINTAFFFGCSIIIWLITFALFY
jgi:hypothetical protein